MMISDCRADVFATKHVSVVEKRILMKFITFCVDFQSHPQVFEKFKDKSYLEFLKVRIPPTRHGEPYSRHTVLLETDVRRSDFVVIFFQLTQNWTALNFEVNFRPLIQWDSSGLFSKSLMKLSNLLSEREIRTSEDVRAS